MPPSSDPVRRTDSRTAAISDPPADVPTVPLTPVGARYSPNTSRSAPAHSPVVTPARAQSSVAAMSEAPAVAAAVSRATAASVRARPSGVPSRSARQACTASIARCSTVGSTVMIAPRRSAVSGFGSVVENVLTPTTTSWPASMRCRRSECDATSADFMYPVSTAATAPPIAWTRSISARAPSTISRTLASITGEPSKMSSYSSRSDSKANTCWIRSDHCWSQGRGRPSASFQAGSWTARARAFFDNVTPSISSTIRCTLFSGWASVRPSELTCTPYRNRRCLGSVTPYRSRVISSHRSTKARILHSSSTNRTPALTKNEMRATTSPNFSAGTCPLVRTASSTAIAVHIAYATSCTGVAPASCRW